MHRKKANTKSNEVVFSNWLAQVAALIMTKIFVAILGRGSSKTTEFLVERLMQCCYEMPGAPLVWVADTYVNLKKNVLPSVMEGLKRKGWIEGIHYVVEKKPPECSVKDMEALPEWLRSTYWLSCNHIVKYTNKIVTYTGANITFVSLDRPASLAGSSYVHVFGDEAKYMREDRVANLLKAVRGYFTLFGNSPLYMGMSFATDMPNTANIGEYDWILKLFKKMDKDYIVQLLKCALVVNETKQELISALEAGDFLMAKKKNLIRIRWEERLLSMRHASRCEYFCMIASSLVNVDILTLKWFITAVENDVGDVKTAIWSIPPSLDSGQRFYSSLTDSHFYKNGTSEYWSNYFGLKGKEDCRILSYLQDDKLLEVSLDFGNMNSMTIAQTQGNVFRIIKDLHTLSPETLTNLGEVFVCFFAPHKRKLVHLYYDRSGNNYNEMNESLAGKVKKAIEKGHDNNPTGWSVTLMSLGQGNIPQTEEYWFMQYFLGGSIKGLPKVMIDYYNCKYLRLSLENTRTKVNSKGNMVKDKSTEKLPIARLPLESSNFSDSFKYLVMRKAWRTLITKGRGSFVGSASVQ